MRQTSKYAFLELVHSVAFSRVRVNGLLSVCHLSLLDRVRKRIVNLVGEELGSLLQPLSHRRSVASLCLFYRYFHGKCATSVSNLVPSVRVFKRETRFSACSHPYTLALSRCRTKSYSNSFFPRTASLWNSLPGDMFSSILQSRLL